MNFDDLAAHDGRSKNIDRLPSSAIVIPYIVGSLLVLAGLLVPSSLLLGLLRATPAQPDFLKQLLPGIVLFKGGLVILGLAIALTGRTALWTPNRLKQERSDQPVPMFDAVVLGAILLVSAALTLYRLDDGLWFDEIVTYANYVRKPIGEIITTYETQNQHVLYSILAHAFLQIFGESVWALRLPAAIFGMGSVGALYLFGRQVTSSKEALFAAALLAFSYHHVWFSQNARGYTGLVFWTLMSSWFFVRALREGRPILWVLYAFSAALGAYTLVYIFFVIVAHFVVYLMTLFSRGEEAWTSRLTGLILGFCLAGFLTFQLYALVLPQVLTAFETVAVVGQVWTHPFWAILEFVRGMRLNFSGSFVGIAAVLVFSAGLWSYARSNFTVVTLLVLPVFVCVAVKWGMGHHLWPRSFIFAVGFGALVVIRGATSLGDLFTRLLSLRFATPQLAGNALCAGLILVSAVSVPYAFGPKQDYIGAMNFVQTTQEPGDSVVTVGLASFAYKQFYKTNWDEAASLEALNAIRSRSKRTWLIYTLPIQLQDAQPGIMASAERDFKIVKRFPGTLGGGDIFIRRADLPPA